MRIPIVVAAVLAVALVSACGSGDESSPFDAPRGLSLAPDGRLIVADAGTGEDDGRVLAVTLASPLEDGPLDAADAEVLLEDLPSQNVEDRGYTGIAGPAAAAVAEDGVACVAISGADDQPGELRCTDGLDVDLAAFEAERNPDGGAVSSDPAGVAADGLRGWFVADAGANTVLFVGRDASITVVGVFKDIEGLGEAGAPIGLFVIPGTDTGPAVGVALFAGALAGFSPALARPPIVQTVDGRPVALSDDGRETFALLRSGLDDDHGSGSVFNMTMSATVVSGLDRPSGFVRLDDGRFVISFEREGNVSVFTAE